jgi:23S rRNA pseudouridine1911/1915/1917 synthase
VTFARHFKGATFIKVAIATGRTHQIRVHLRSIGHPLLGDPVYGEPRHRAASGAAAAVLAELARPALHAWRIELDHPRTGERLRLEAPVPEDLARLWSALGGAPLAAVLRD